MRWGWIWRRRISTGFDGRGRIMATVYGDTVWAMAAETGLRAQSYDIDLTVDESLVPDEDGDDVGGAFYNEKASFSLNGFETTGGFAGVVGAAITVANAVDLDGFIAGDASGGTTILTGRKTNKGNREMVSVDASGTFFPFFGALQV